MKYQLDDLITAIEENDLDKIKEIHEEGYVDFNSMPRDNVSIAALAIENGNLEIIKYILDITKDYEVSGGWMPLLGLAIDCGNIDVVRLLVENGANVNFRYSNGTSYISYCCYIEITRSILLYDEFEDSVFAEENEYLKYLDDNTFGDIVEYLLKNGADFTSSNDKGHTPLSLIKEKTIKYNFYKTRIHHEIKKHILKKQFERRLLRKKG